MLDICEFLQDSWILPQHAHLFLMKAAIQRLSSPHLKPHSSFHTLLDERRSATTVEDLEQVYRHQVSLKQQRPAQTSNRQVALVDEETDILERTALLVSVFRECSPLVVSWFMEKGSDIHAVGCFGDSVLHFASSEEVIALLVRFGACPNARNRLGRSPLHRAVISGYQIGMKLARPLLRMGCDPSLRDGWGRQAKDYLESAHETKPLQVLLSMDMSMIQTLCSVKCVARVENATSNGRYCWFQCLPLEVIKMVVLVAGYKPKIL